MFRVGNRLRIMFSRVLDSRFRGNDALRERVERVRVESREELGRAHRVVGRLR